MNDETEANPASVVEETQPQQAEAETFDDLDLVDEGEEESPVVETVKIERNGKTFEIPKELEGEMLMHQDYTKKTMTLAEERKAAQAEIESQRQAVQQREADIEVFAELKQLEARKTQLESLDPNELRALRDSDPLEFDRLEREYDRIERAIRDKNDHLSKRQREIEEAGERERANYRQAQLAEAAKMVPNFTDEKRTSLEKLAIEKGGYTADQLKLASAADYALLDLAADGLKLRQARQNAAKQKAAATAEPAAEIRGRAAPVKALDDRASTEAWMKARNQVVSR